MMRSISGMLRSEWVSGLSRPGIGGTIGPAPGLSSRKSYDSTYSDSSNRFLIVTVLSCRLIDTTSFITRTSTLKRAKKLSGVCSSNLLRSWISPPM